MCLEHLKQADVFWQQFSCLPFWEQEVCGRYIYKIADCEGVILMSAVVCMVRLADVALNNGIVCISKVLQCAHNEVFYSGHGVW
jgi:hypothetical protein